MKADAPDSQDARTRPSSAPEHELRFVGECAAWGVPANTLRSTCRSPSRVRRHVRHGSPHPLSFGDLHDYAFVRARQHRCTETAPLEGAAILPSWLMTRLMTSLAIACFPFVVTEGFAMAETIDFDQDKTGALPAGWKSGVTGRGSPRWTVEQDETAPSPPNVLKQSGSGTFPWCVKSDTSIENGTVAVKFKPISGREDAAGGVVWRWKNGDTYYVARANALENNVSLYYTANGRRNTIKYVDAPVAKNQWHTLEIEFSGQSIRVALDGKLYIEQKDDHIAG